MGFPTQTDIQTYIIYTYIVGNLNPVWDSLHSPNYIHDEEIEEFPILSVGRNGLPALNWTQKCECRLEMRCSVLVNLCESGEVTA